MGRINVYKFEQICKACNHWNAKGRPDKVVKLCNYVTKKGDEKQCLSFAKRMCKITDVSQIQERVIQSSNQEIAFLYARDVATADILRLQAASILNDKEGRVLHHFSNLKGANIDFIIDFYMQDKFVQNKAYPLVNVAQSKYITKEQFERIQKYILDRKVPFECDMLARNCPQCDIKQIEEVIYSSNNTDLIRTFRSCGRNIDHEKWFNAYKTSMLNSSQSYEDLVVFVRGNKDKLSESDIEQFKEKIIKAASYFSDGWDIADERSQYNEIVKDVKSGEIFERDTF